jgi:hypothetical protein
MNVTNGTVPEWSDPVRVGLYAFFMGTCGFLAVLSFISLILIIVFRNVEPIKGRRVYAFVATATLFFLDIERTSISSGWVPAPGTSLRCVLHKN